MKGDMLRNRSIVVEMKKITYLCAFLIACGGLTACGNSETPESSSVQDSSLSASESSESSSDSSSAWGALGGDDEKEVEKKTYSDTILPEEKESIKVEKLSKNHEFYSEVVSLDPDCADYINEISIYDKEIDDTFVVHVSLPPDYDETKTYPMVVMTDGIWRLSDHPELRPLMVNDEIEDVILVSVGYPDGYDYTKIRERDLVDDPESYLHFIVDNLVPYLEDTYPADSENMTLTGHSYGGYWAYYALFNSDTIGKNTFANYYIGSPSLGAMTGINTLYDYEDEYFSRSQNLSANVYVTVGGDEDKSFISAVEKFDEQVKSRNYEGLNLTYEVIDGYTHETVFKPSIKNTLLKFYAK